MAGDVPDAVVADVARQLVTQAAPQELPLFRATSEAYFADPEKTLARRGGKDEMLGFGVEAAVILITPVALDVAKRVVAWVAGQVGDSVKKEGSEKIGEVVHDLFDRRLLLMIWRVFDVLDVLLGHCRQTGRCVEHRLCTALELFLFAQALFETLAATTERLVDRFRRRCEAALKDVPAGTGYSTSHGGVVEGERMLVGYIHKERGTGSRMHTHKNEQFNYVVRGTLIGSVNGKKVNIPSYLVRPRDVVAVKEASKTVARISEALAAVDRRGVPRWIELDKDGMRGGISSLPARDDVNLPIKEQLIIELYSK